MERYAPTIKDLAPATWSAARSTSRSKRGAAQARTRDYVYLHVDHLDPHIVEEKLPDITEFARIYLGVEPLKEGVPIQPTAHYAMGGIPTTIEARAISDASNTPVPGLYAAGECACVKRPRRQQARHEFIARHRRVRSPRRHQHGRGGFELEFRATSEDPHRDVEGCSRI